MPGIVLQRDVAALGALVRLADASSATAGGTGDATSVTGATIDRLGFGNGSPAGVMNAGVFFEAVLASAATLSIGYAVQDSADGTNWTDYQTATYAVVATGASGGSTAKGTFDIGSVNLSSARRYVRLNYKPDLSAANTDTANFRAVGFAAGFDRVPA